MPKETEAYSWRGGKFLILPFVLIVTASCVGRDSGFKDETSFTEHVAEELRKTSALTVRVSAPLTLEIQCPDGTNSTSGLDTLWKECNLRPEACSSSIDHHVRTASECGKLPAPSREALRATVKTKSWIDDFKKKGGVPVARPFVGDLWKVYVFDRPDNIVGVHKGDLAKLKITEEELDTLALANLEAAITDFPHEPIEEGSPIHVIHAGDNYEASRLLLHHRWRALAQEVKGELLVSAPSRDFVFFVGSRSDRSVLAHFRRKMQEVLSLESYPLSAQVLRWTPEKWVVYDIENH